MPIRLYTEKVCAHQGIEHLVARRAINATQSLHLCCRQAQTGHLQILGADALDHVRARRECRIAVGWRHWNSSGARVPFTGLSLVKTGRSIMCFLTRWPGKVTG
jgi:hypothetical protein